MHRWLFGLALLPAALLTGCQPATAPTVDGTEQVPTGPVVDAGALGLDADALPMLDSAPMPETFAAAVSELTKMRDVIAAGFAADDVDSIHDQLHEIGDLLEATEKLLADTKLDADAKKAGAAAIETLFDEFGAVDATLHGEEGKEYADVSDSIDQAIAQLTEMLTKLK